MAPEPGIIKRPMRTSNEVNETVSELKEDVHKLQEQVDRMRDSMIVLSDVMKLLTCKVYGDTPDESAEEIFLKTVKMVNSWD